MICSDRLDRQSAQTHRLVLLVAEVLVEVEMVLVVSGFLVKKGMIPHESVILDGGRRRCCSLALRLRLGALGSFSLGLARLGGIDTHLDASGLCRFASLLLQ